MTDQLAEIAGPPRDRWGRYKLPDPATGKTISYTRATTVAKAPEDQGGLMKWAQRMVVVGLGRRSDLHALAATTSPDDKKTLGQITRAAEEAGGSATGRNTGTAIHSAIEAVNRGDEPLPLFAAEVDAYRTALRDAGLSPMPDLVERVVVNTRDKIAGTFDVGLHDVHGTSYVGDLKTGSVDYPAAMAIQLAIYAGADAIVPTGCWDRLDRTHPFNQERGIIIHLPEGGPCTLYWIDLEAGRRGLAVALGVRGWRSEAKAPKLLTEVVAADNPNTHAVADVGVVGTVERPTTNGYRSPESVTGAARPGERAGAEEAALSAGLTSAPADRLAWFNARYGEVVGAGVDKARIAAQWPVDCPPPSKRDQWTAAQLDAACDVVKALHNEAGLDFPAPDPMTPPPVRRPKLPKPRATKITVEGTELERLRDEFHALSDDARSAVLGWQSQGNQADREWTLGKESAPKREWTVNAAALALARHTDDDEIARGWIALVIGDDLSQNFPPGALMGALSFSEAEQLLTLTGHDTFAAALAAA